MGQKSSEDLAEARRRRGAKIKELRLQRGLKKSELAAGCRTSYSHIDNIEHARKQPSIELLYRIAHRLDVPVQEIELDAFLDEDTRDPMCVPSAPAVAVAAQEAL
jgi:transcriptional regulator with XRE-family HTH domain